MGSLRPDGADEMTGDPTVSQEQRALQERVKAQARERIAGITSKGPAEPREWPEGTGVLTFEEVQDICARLIGREGVKEVVLIPGRPGLRIVILETFPDVVYRYEDAPEPAED